MQKMNINLLAVKVACCLEAPSQGWRGCQRDRETLLEKLLAFLNHLRLEAQSEAGVQPSHHLTPV